MKERHILWEGTSSRPISSSWSQGVPTLASPCKPYRQRRPNTSLDSRFWLADSLKISPHGSHITWSPSGYTPAWPACPDALPPPSLLITTWQLVKAHGVTRNEPKIHFKSHYITILSIPFFKMTTYGHFLHVSLRLPSTLRTKQNKYRNNSKNITILR